MLAKFFDLLDEIDSLIISAPTPAAVDRMLVLTAEPAVRQYTFSRLDRDDWLDPLRKRQAFDSIGANTDAATELKYGRPWPELDYLRRVARKWPDEVLEIAVRIAPANNWSLATAITGLGLALPPDHAARLVPKILESMRHSPGAWELAADDINKLLALLATHRETDATLELLREAIDVLPDPRLAKMNELRMPPSPRGKLDDWGYSRLLQTTLPIIVDAIGVQIVAVVAATLNSALELSRMRDSSDDTADYSYIWMPDISAADMNSSHNVRDMLVVALRNTASRASSDLKALRKCLTIFRAYRFHVFERLSIDLLSTRGALDPKYSAARATLLKRKYFLGYEYKTEYSALAKAFFGVLTEKERSKIYNWLDQGPGDATLRRVHKMIFGENPTPEQLDERFRRWQLDKLEMFGPDLPKRYQHRLSELLQQFGPTPPRGVQVRWKDPVEDSPLDFTGLDTRAMARALTEWDATPGQTPETAYGIVRSISAVIAVGNVAGSILDFRSTNVKYVKAVFGALRERIRSRAPIPWSDAIQLGQWAFDQTENDSTNDNTRDNADIRRSVVDFLDEALKPGAVEAPIVEREAIWSLLRDGALSPDPMLEEAKEESDPATLSINSLRGIAMHAVVKYGLWVRSVNEPATTAIRETAPEVIELLDDRLDASREPSPAVRAVYGQWFPWLVLLDRAWASNAAPLVFGTRNGISSELGRAAWVSYLTFCDVYSEVVPLLLEVYRTALTWIGSWGTNPSRLAEPDERLGEHVFMVYWRNMAGREGEELLNAFSATASPELRGHTFDFVGRALTSLKSPDLQSTIPRLQKFVESRLVANGKLSLEQRRQELNGFGWWFSSGHFENDWVFPELLKVLALTDGSIDAVSKVLDAVQTEAGIRQVEAVQIVRYILFAPTTRHHWPSQTVRSILTSALTDPKAQPLVDDVVQRLGKEGWFEYRDLATGRRIKERVLSRS
ncbi:MAG: hypothetical protein WD802_01525 [Gemmatimonadaceae bacterium]